MRRIITFFFGFLLAFSVSATISQRSERPFSVIRGMGGLLERTGYVN